MSIAGGPSWARAVGFTLLVLLAAEAVTGIALMTTYAPTIEAAWASVHYTTYLAPHGWLLRGLHRFAGEAMLVLAAAHVAMLAMGGWHRKPREIGYLAALLLVVAIAAACVTGGILPWDQQGYWARRVELGIVSMAPGGAWIARFAQGGSDLGQLSLTRFFTGHVILLPLACAALLRLRGLSARKSAGSEPYFPRQMARDIALAVSVLLVVGWMTNKVHGAPLDAPADPASDYPARPEWYLMWLFELRRHLHGPWEYLGTMGVPLILVLCFAALPWVEKRTHGQSVLGTILVVASFALVVPLGYRAMQRDSSDAKYASARRKANERAATAIELAMHGVPVGGGLAMLQNDPELRGEALFEQHCASCHVLGRLGDKAKATAPVLDGWSTTPWILAMLHDPDGEERFGRTPYDGNMPSMDVPPKDDDGSFKPMAETDKLAVASFLSGDARADAAMLDAGATIVKDRCTTCHLFHGEGDDDGEGLAPELAGYGSLSWVRTQIADPSSKATYREGALDPKLKHHMPKLDNDLTPADIDLLARWVRAKARRSRT